MSNIERLEPDPTFTDRVIANGGTTVKKCFQCATCSVVCTLSPKDRPFPRKEMLWAQWGLRDRLVGDPDIWLCHHCGDCSVHCPRGAKPGETLQAIRATVVSELAFPRVVARALSQPKLFPALLLLPMLLMGVSMWEAGTLQVHEGPIVYAKLMPHSIVFEGLFMLLAGWSMLVGAIGIARQWDLMKRVCPAASDAKGRPLGESFTQALKEIVLHDRFRACGQNRARATAHILVIAGFFAAMAAAGGGAVMEKVFHIDPPIPNLHPVKLMGVLGAIGLVVGTSLLISRRLSEKQQVGESSFFDWAFLGVLCAVGVTGTLSYLVRLSGAPELSYATYFVHLSLVVFLLSTVGYTKFAHVFYRTAAMTYAIHTGRVVEQPAAVLPAPARHDELVGQQ